MKNGLAVHRTLINGERQKRGGDFDSAFGHANQLQKIGRLSEARSEFQVLLREPSLTKPQQASVHLELSRIDLSDGHYSNSISDGDQAAKLFQAESDSANEGYALTITGLAHTYSGEYDAALHDSETALKIARNLRDSAAEVTRLNNIGNVFYFEGRYTDALSQYESAMSVVSSHPDESWAAARRQLTAANLASLYQRLGLYARALETYSGLRASGGALQAEEQAQLLANMGSLYRRLGDPLKALETYRAAQQLFRQRRLRSGEIAVLINIGIAQALDLRQLPEALHTFNEALHLALTSGARPGAVHAQLYRAETLFRMHRVDEAERDFTVAAAGANTLHAGEEHWKALYGLARIAGQQADPVREISILHRAVALIESLRGSGPAALRGGFLADKRQVYDLLIDRLAREANPNAPDIYRLMELSRARTLQDRKRNTRSLEALRRDLPHDTLLLEYWIGDDSIAVLWCTSKAFGVTYRPAESSLRERLRAFRGMLADPHNNQWHDAARSIGADLLGSTDPILVDPAIRRLIVVPDREVSLIPFETLPLPSRRAMRLMDVVTVSYLPSGALMPVLTQRPAERRPFAPFWTRTVLAFADPAPGVGKSVFGAFSAPQRRLPAASDEVHNIADSIGGRTSLFIGSGATKANLRRALNQHFSLIHFATHAFSDPEDPAHSFILMAPGSPQVWDYLFPEEISALDLQGVALVTASACETETGKLVEGEGIAGFSRAFLGAGARAVVTSLWQVGDRPTANLMRIFYRELANGMPVAQALQRAKVELSAQASPEQAHPFYWAAFVLNGQPAVQLPIMIPWTFLAAGAFALAGFAMLLWNLRKRV